MIESIKSENGLEMQFYLVICPSKINLGLFVSYEYKEGEMYR